MRVRLLFVVSLWAAIGATSSARAACLDVSTGPVSLAGVLSHRIFAGPPNYESVRQGDAPEPTYILKLDLPICATGDDFLEAGKFFTEVQLFTTPDEQAVQRAFRRFNGRHVVVEGEGAFGAHTGHHHAPLVLPVKRVTLSAVPARSRRGASVNAASLNDKPS